MQTLTWNEIAPGVWRARFGEPEEYTLLTAAGGAPREDALHALPQTTFPLNEADLLGEVRKGKVALRFPLGAGEDIYGLGLDFKRVRRNKTVLHLHADAWGGVPGRTHAPVPFYVSSRGYGVLVNSARYLTFYIGTGIRTDSAQPPTVYDRNTSKGKWQAVPDGDSIEVLVPADGVEVLVFAGPTPMEAVRRYNLFCGGGCLPPKWGLGFTHRTPTLYTDEQVTKEAEEFEERGFPLDFIGLEPGWHDHSYPCSFEWDKTRFPNPGDTVKALHEKGVRVNLWFNPYVAPQAPLAEKIKPYVGSHTVWNGLVPDYTIPEARQTFSAHLDKTLLALGPGIGGVKIDEVDGHDHWLWPDVATFPSGHDAEQLRQTYGLLMRRTVFEQFHAADRRTYGLARGDNAGGCRFPFVIYSDSYGFAEYITALCNSGFSGLLWTPEVRSAKTSEEWLRRIQAVCFSPMAMLNAWANGTKPWTFPEVETAVRDVMLLRMRLLPYLYTTFAQYHFEGTPPIRPLQLLSGFAGAGQAEQSKLDDTTNPYEEARVRDIGDQFMLGDSLLVAPIAPGKEEREVALPPGKWYDFYTGELAGKGGVITVAAALEHIPLFVRDGGIIPLLPARLYAPKAGEVVPLEVWHFGTALSTFRLYDDDGETFAYEKGAFSWTTLRAARDASGNWQGVVERDTRPDAPLAYNQITWRFRTVPAG
jgi:alpha-glucosidase (family GH31 glycosyl hydrolase)